MKLAVHIALLALAFAPIAAFGDNSPHVVVATPGVGDGSIERFTVRFDQAMVALGDPRAASPFQVECPVEGTGRWAAQQTYVYEFAKPLPGGIKCTFSTRTGMKSVSGYALAGDQVFTGDSGGPMARAILPGENSDEIEEDQVFLVAANLPATAQSVAANAYCSVEGLGEKFPVDVLAPDTAAKVLGEMGTSDYSVQSFLSEGGMPTDMPASLTDRQKMLASVTALKCRRPLPQGHDMALVWSGKIASAGGKPAGTDQRFDFTVRKPFAARFECGRTNAQAGCDPVEKAYLRFTAPIMMSDAQQMRLTTAEGTEIKPVFSKDEMKSATISDVTFAGPMPYSTTATVSLPAGVKDESGRPLTNAERFPLDIRIDAAPPLVKFAASFGILELKEGGVLPVTVRNVAPALQGQNLAVAGQSLRVAGSDGKIAEWLRTVDSAVELASPTLGRALLGRNAPRYVATAALVTNMAVHFKWGRERSLAWVTSLDSGQPVANAAVRVTDSCSGEVLANGTTDRSGAVFIPEGLPEPSAYGGSCYSGSSDRALMISARAGGDYSFTLSGWGEGIRPYDFDLPYGYSKSGEVFHTVFYRALVRQGETIHMKHIVRQPQGAGFSVGPGFTGTLRLSHRGSDTQFDLPLTIDANGIGETEWTAPKGAPMGDYDIQVIDGDNTIY